MGLVQTEIDEELIVDGLRVVIEESWDISIAPEEPKGVTVDKVGRCSSQTDHAGIEVFDDFREPPEERAVGLIEDGEIEEP
jgi:hypothetical protein